LAYSHNVRLGTYATYWIRARITRTIQSREHVIRFPEHVLQASYRLVKASKEFGLTWDTVSKLADVNVISVHQERLRKELRSAAGIKSDSLFHEAVRVREMSTRSATQLESWMSPASRGDGDELHVEAGPEHIRHILSRFLIPREVEVLSLRYCLVSSEGKEARQEELIAFAPSSVPLRKVFRDYQAEAEEELFGPKGPLSHYSLTPNDNVHTISKFKSQVQPIDKCQVHISGNMMKARSSLLPFKEIGKQMKFSGEYCRRTCSSALKKLTQAVEEGLLEESDFLLGFEY